MAPLSELGRWIIFAGLVLATIGLLVWLFGQIPGLERMPGTWTWESDNVRVIAPIGLMIALSILLTIVLNLIVRFFR
jgi:hypothetical protein